MIRLRAQGMKAAAIVALSLLIAGVSFTAASATTAKATVAEECVPSEAWTETVIDKPAVDEVTELRWHVYAGNWNTDETPSVDDSHWQVTGAAPHGTVHQGRTPGVPYAVDKSGPGNGSDWFLWKSVVVTPGEDAVTHTVEHDAVTCPDPEPEILTEWYTWDTGTWTPDATGLDDVGWPQTLVGPGQIAPTDCETTFQQDKYVGTRAQIDAVIGDGVLDGPNPPEDHAIVTQWALASTEACPVTTTHFMTIIWNMNPIGAPPVFTPAQTIVDSTETDAPDLSAFDSLLVGNCVGFQVDVYKYTLADDKAQVDNLISVGVLNGPGNPAEPLIDGGLGTAWKFYQNSDCAQSEAVYPVFPDPVPPTCDADGTLPPTPAASGGIEYAWDEDGKTLLATATEGNYIPEGTATSRTYDELGSATGYQSSDVEGDCYTGQPEGLSGETPSATGQCTIPVDGTFTTVTTTTPWTQEYMLDTVTGVWSLGEKVNGEPVVTSSTAPDENCDVERAAVAAVAVDPPICGPNNDVVDVPPSTDEVTYSDTGWVNNERTVTATAQEGFTLLGTKSWTFTDSATTCPVQLTGSDVTPKAPTVVPLCFPNNDTVTIPTTTGVMYTDGGWVLGVRTITASATEGYALIGTKSWAFTDVPSASCPDVPTGFAFVPTALVPTALAPAALASTGTSSNTGGYIGLALFLIASGSVLVSRKVRA